MKSFTILLLCLMSLFAAPVGWADAESDLDQAIDLLRQQGMPEEQLQQMADQLRAMQQMEQQQQQRRTDAKNKQRQAVATREQQLAEFADQNLQPTPGKLTIALGEELVSLTIYQCTTQNRLDGNLQVVADVAAYGDFRGSPAMVRLSKSHPAGNPQALYQLLEVWLTELTAAEQALTPQQVLAQREADYNAWYAPRVKAVQAAHQVTDSMSVTQMTATMDAQDAAMKALQAEADAKAIAYSNSHGKIRLQDQTLSFNGQRLHYSGRGRTPDALTNIEGSATKAAARCP